MTNNTMKKMEEAKKMMEYVKELGYLEDGKFTPTEYDGYRRQWEEATPTWNTLKKYAKEVGLVAEEVAFEWHSDGSLLAELCSLKDGDIFYHTMYHFA